MKQTITTSTGRTLTARTAKVGTNHGYCGQLVARNGRVIWEGDAVPFAERAMEQAVDEAAKR